MSNPNLASPRYSVDHRVGCIAVVDNMVTPDGPGLHPDSRQVVWFAMGRHVPRWKKLLKLAPKHAIWEVPGGVRRDAGRVAKELNLKEGQV